MLISGISTPVSRAIFVFLLCLVLLVVGQGVQYGRLRLIEIGKRERALRRFPLSPVFGHSRRPPAPPSVRMPTYSMLGRIARCMVPKIAQVLVEDDCDIQLKGLAMAALDEPIHLAEYNPRWPYFYAMEEARISSGLPAADIAIEHIGSTAGPGLAAKPIIDVMVGAKESHNLAAVRAALVALGYEDMGEAGVPGRLYFRKREEQPFNVALVEYDGKHWKSNLALREFLRVNPRAAQEYAEIKATAFKQGRHSLLAYSEFKHFFVVKLVREALAFDSHQNQSGPNLPQGR